MNQSSIEKKHQKHFDKATEIGVEINKHIMTLSTGALAAYFFLFLNPKVELVEVEKILLTLAIFVFGTAVFIALLVWQNQADRSYLIGNSLHPDNQEKQKKSAIIMAKRSLDKRLKLQKRAVRWLFIFGILLSIFFILYHVFGLPING